MSSLISGKNHKKICSKCVLPEIPPNIILDKDGICNICHHSLRQKPLTYCENDFLKIVNKIRGKYRYDCLVMCSGGKDSIFALYSMKKRYKLNPLVFTFDLGFETEDAFKNIHNAVDILNVDLLVHTTHKMKKMFKNIIQENNHIVLCHPCSIFYVNLAYKTAKRYKIPIIIAGWTKGQVKTNDLEGKLLQTNEHMTLFLNKFISNNSEYKNFPRSMDEVIKKNKKISVLSPHWFSPHAQEDYIKIIQNELKWKAPKKSYPHGSTNCTLNFLSTYLSLKQYGITHYHVELSKLIRQGIISREDALAQLEINFTKELISEIKNKIITDLP